MNNVKTTEIQEILKTINKINKITEINYLINFNLLNLFLININ